MRFLEREREEKTQRVRERANSVQFLVFSPVFFLFCSSSVFSLICSFSPLCFFVSFSACSPTRSPVLPSVFIQRKLVSASSSSLPFNPPLQKLSPFVPLYVNPALPFSAPHFFSLCVNHSPPFLPEFSFFWSCMAAVFVACRR